MFFWSVLLSLARKALLPLISHSFYFYEASVNFHPLQLSMPAHLFSAPPFLCLNSSLWVSNPFPCVFYCCRNSSCPFFLWFKQWCCGHYVACPLLGWFQFCRFALKGPFRVWLTPEWPLLFSTFGFWVVFLFRRNLIFGCLLVLGVEWWRIHRFFPSKPLSL